MGYECNDERNEYVADETAHPYRGWAVLLM